MTMRKKANAADQLYVQQNRHMSAAEISSAINLEEGVVEELLLALPKAEPSKTWAQKMHKVKDGVHQAIGADPNEEEVAQRATAGMKKPYVYTKPE